MQLEPYMDEAFLSNAMIQMGQDGVVSIKVRSSWLQRLVDGTQMSSK